MKEERIVKMQFQKSGAGNITTRVTLPIVWVRDELGITKEEREVKIKLEDDKIIIEKL